ncbi:MAG: type VII secretion protein EccB, partial [Kibdelosporangium sp.]
GLLATALPLAAGRRTPDRYLITDQGVKYLIPDDESATALGLGGSPPVPIARELLTALPTGPALSRAALSTEKG